MPEVENKVKKSFFQNMKAELKKVIWPTGKQTVKSTAATIAFVLLIAVTLIALNTVFDLANEYLMKLIIK
jgi:preprotein translocase subunit SecE